MPALFVLALALLGVLVAYPMLALVVTAFTHQGSPSLHHLITALSQSENLNALWNSLWISVLATAGATIIGTALAWSVARTDMPGRKVLRALFLIPFLIPPFIYALAIQQLLGPIGYLNRFWRELAGGILFDINSAPGIIIVLALGSYPFAYLTMLTAFERLPVELEEAAQISGASRWHVIRTVTLPMLAPTIGAGAVLAFVASISNFGVPAILGFRRGIQVLTTRIYEEITRGVDSDRLAVAAALSLVLGLFGGAGILLQRLLSGRRKFTLISGRGGSGDIMRLGPFRWAMTSFGWTFVILTSILPLAAILLTSLLQAPGVPLSLDAISLRWFERLMVASPRIQQAALNSLFLAFFAATVTTLVGTVLGFLIGRARVPGAGFIDWLATLPYSIPGTVVAIAMILAWLQPIPLLGFSIYNTIWILLVAYVARYLAFAVRGSLASLQQIGETLEEAARISGATPWQSTRDVLVPLLRPAMRSAWILVFIPALQELTLSALLVGPRSQTLGYAVFNLQDGGLINLAAALSVVMLTGLGILTVIVGPLRSGRPGVS
ncbi:MAG: iron ABC transporter permease [Trueperaceae bacterium]